MLDALLQSSTVTRLLHLLQAAQPFLTPSWSRLADMCIRLLSISELFSGSRKTDFTRLLHDVRGCTPSNDMNALLCAIRPFCSEEELQMLQMYEQFKQMQQAMDLWKMFSDLMPDAADATGNGFDRMFSGFMNSPSAMHKTESPSESSTPEPVTVAEGTANPLLSFLSPEQLELYNSILSD